jgi:hypothetical protein
MNLKILKDVRNRRTVSEIVQLGVADDIRLYKAMCSAGLLPWNLRMFCEDVYRGQLNGTITDRAVLNWVHADPICKAIEKGACEVSREWAKKAKDEFSSWGK